MLPESVTFDHGPPTPNLFSGRVNFFIDRRVVLVWLLRRSHYRDDLLQGRVVSAKYWRWSNRRLRHGHYIDTGRPH